jgi:signal transduction histidine kinase
MCSGRRLGTAPKLWATATMMELKRETADYMRCPENFEIAVIVVAVVALTLACVGALHAGGIGPDASILLAGCGFICLCVVAGSVMARRRHRAAALLAHFLLTIILAFTFRDVGSHIGLLLLVILELHVALRLPLPAAVVADAIALAAVVTLTLARGDTVPRTIEATFVAVAIALLAETTIVNRERVVRATLRIAAQSRSLESLAAANQSFVAHLESVKAETSERERRLITRELHDCIGYSMTNVVMMMNAAQYFRQDDQEKLLEYCEKTRTLASNTLQETRQILYRLRSVASQATLSPPVFFTRLCNDFAEATGVRTDCNLGNLPPAISEDGFNTLFRVVQVGFINALRHGNTGHIELSFWVGDESLRMCIWNDVPDGVPISSVTEEGIGLRGARERLALLNGTAGYGPVANGWQLEIELPREELMVERH